MKAVEAGQNKERRSVKFRCQESTPDPDKRGYTQLPEVPKTLDLAAQ